LIKEILVKLSDLARFGLRHSWPVLGILALAILSEPSARIDKTPGQTRSEPRNLLAAYGADAVMIDRNARDFKLPEQIEWKSRPGSSSQTAVLFGDPSKPGLYGQLLKRGPNDWSEPHAHTNDRILTVLAGTMWIGTGPKQDRANTIPIKAGGYVRDIAGQMHYDGSGPEGLTLEIIGIGPVERQ
jgi:hypothetical protein